MTDEMGYKNVDRVYALAKRGVFSKPNGESLTVNMTALNMMTYMALKAINKEDRKAVDGAGKAYWCYYGGWSEMASDMGFTLVPAGLDDENVAAVLEAHSRTAVNRLSRTAKFLQAQGAIKLLRPASTIGQKRNALWLLLLGESDEENAEAERVARRAFGLPEA